MNLEEFLILGFVVAAWLMVAAGVAGLILSWS